MKAPTSSKAPLLRRGTRLGKYQLVKRLGVGGFSQVWKAKDTLENQWVALKIPRITGSNSMDEEDLLEEIRLSARLDHPNIARIRNADKIGDWYVIANELAIESLEQRLTRRLGTPRAISYIHQILRGLVYAHKKRVIHRDLKPSNLMLFPGDRLKISDFGLARVSRDSILSATGSGTLLYFAPEQAHGYPCFASDVFSVGLICHELLTGKLPRWPFEWPFEGLRVLRSKVPPEMVGIIRKATQFDHRQRYHDAIEMLASFERTEPLIRKFLSPRSKPRRRRKRLGAWKKIRFREFQRAFGKRLFVRFECPDCQGPISELMSNCPWCGCGSILFGEETEFPCFCGKCYRGLREEWSFCPWCWGPGFPDADGKVRHDARYRGICPGCDGPLMDGMRYCPWCHRKIAKPVQIPELPDTCRRCKGPVSRDFWEYCPWCTSPLKTPKH